MQEFVEEVRDVDASLPVPTQEVQLVGQALNTFAWPTHLIQPFSEQVFPFVVFIIIKKRFVTNKALTIIDLCLLTVYDKQGPVKLVDRPEPDDNLLY